MNAPVLSRILTGCSLLFGSLVGCGGGVDSRPLVVPASGTVTMQGSPLADAQIVFVPTTNDRPAAYASTDSAGRFSLTTFEAEDGASPGEYEVAVTKQRTEGEMTSDEAQAYFTRTGTPPPSPKFIDLIPAHYADRTTSGLTATVMAEGENRFSFELTDRTARD